MENFLGAQVVIPTNNGYSETMNTLEAFIIVIMFLAKLGGIAIFIVGAWHTWLWLTETVAPRIVRAFEDDEDDEDEWA